MAGYDDAIGGFFKDLWRKGHLVERSTPGLYCEACSKYLFEVHVHGGCPHCGAKCNGNFCEACARPNDCTDMKEPVCKTCGGTPTLRNFKRLHLDWNNLSAATRELYEAGHMNTRLRVLGERMLADGLPDLPVSHIADWGIPVPVDGFDGQAVWVWFEMASGYLIGIRDLGRRLGWWTGGDTLTPPSGTELVQFFGIDNGYYHTLLFPLLFKLHAPENAMKFTFVCNEFYCLDGLKFSTSRNHAVWGRELLDRYPRDVVRYFLCRTRPEVEQTNFTRADFERTVHSELVDGVQRWLHEVDRRLRAAFGGVAPEPGLWTDTHREFLARLDNLLAACAKAYEADTFSPQAAVRIIGELVIEAQRLGASEAHWALAPNRTDEQRTALAVELAACSVLARAIAPMMPDFAVALWQDLGQPGPVHLHWPSDLNGCHLDPALTSGAPTSQFDRGRTPGRTPLRARDLGVASGR